MTHPFQPLVQKSSQGLCLSTGFPIRSFGAKTSKKDDQVTKKIKVPKELVDTQFTRSSGPGGQNVNKLNTKASIRFEISSAHWLDEAIGERLAQQRPQNVTKDGYFVVTSQVYRT
mmetsp:Transcript_2969/g.5019  ORF Transcript_2969/g.5019 Transcript_2969/m.5019 type:complete len:115 (-) Transcript_2969:263-607(-)